MNDSGVGFSVRALVSNPKLLLLDEPAAGLNSNETKDLQALLEKVSKSGTTLLVVEHDMNFVRNLCQNVVVLNFGRKIFVRFKTYSFSLF